MKEVTSLMDPCPFPSSQKRRLNEKEKLIYAPMSDLGNIFFDKDAIYVNIPHLSDEQDQSIRKNRTKKTFLN